MKKVFLFILLLKANFISACPLSKWIQNDHNDIHYIKYNLPLPDQNHLHITSHKIHHKKEFLLKQKPYSQWFLFQTGGGGLWFPSSHHKCSRSFTAIINHSGNKNLEKKIEYEVSSYKKEIKKYFSNYSLNAIFIVKALQKLGSYNPKYKFILIKSKSWDFSVHKTLIHELSHGLEKHHPEWFSEGLSEWIAIQYLKNIYPKKIYALKNLIQRKKFKNISLKKWEGRWKYEKSYKAVDFIVSHLGKDKFFQKLQKENYLDLLMKSLPNEQQKKLEKMIQ